MNTSDEFHDAVAALRNPDGSCNVAAFNTVISRLGHSGWLGHRFHAADEGWLELAMDWREDLVGDPDTGVLASGPIVALMDNAAGTAVWLKRGVLGAQVTIDLRVDYMRPATPRATVIARCECYRLTRQIAFVRGIGYDATPDDPLCHVTGTFMLLDQPAGTQATEAKS